MIEVKQRTYSGHLKKVKSDVILFRIIFNSHFSMLVPVNLIQMHQMSFNC